MIQDFKNSHLVMFSEIIINRYLLFFIFIIFNSCSSKFDSYKSQCDKIKVYEKVNFDELLKNINNYQGKYVEIKGKYKSDSEQSAIYSDEFTLKKNYDDALWVTFDDFISRCPLMSSNDVNLFGNENTFKDMYNKTIILHGRIDIDNKGHLSQYRASIKDISMVLIQ